MGKSVSVNSGKMGGPTPSSGKAGTVNGGIPKGVTK
jgi:hypothetical protein